MDPKENPLHPLLSEMLREAERAIDHQLRVVAELDNKTEQMIRLGVATFGGGLAVLAFLLDRSDAPATMGFRISVGVVMALNFVALLLFLDAYLGIRRRHRGQLGPDLAWLATKANDEAWEADTHLVTLVINYADYFRVNAKLMESAARPRRVGLGMLVGAVLGYAGVALYLL